MAWRTGGEGGDTVLITALPPRDGGEAEPPAREFVFVIDRSGSMGGEPIAQARNALRACLRSLGPADTFAILAFNEQFEWLAEHALPADDVHLKRADQWLDGIEGTGGTEILPALEASLGMQRDPARRRYLIFLTDGAVSAEARALELIERKLGDVRLFSFGIGPSVNRALLARMALLGRGSSEFLQLDEDIEDAIIRFQDRVSYPALEDLSLVWEGIEAWDIYPERLPDLFFGQSLSLLARVHSGRTGRLVLAGRRGAENVRLEVEIPAAPTPEPALLGAWARARIESLEDAVTRTENEEARVRGEIIGLALQHRLVTSYTSFVAVDTETAATKPPRRIEVSLPLPAALDRTGFDMVMGLAMPLKSMPMASIDKRLFGGAPARALYMQDRSGERLPPLKQVDPLRVLARTQNASGSWGSGKTEVETTAAALIEFIRAGHTPLAGNYRRQLAKALAWLVAAKATGPAAKMRDQALAMLAEAVGDPAMTKLLAVAAAAASKPQAPESV